MHFDWFDMIFHCRVVNIKLLISWRINSKNGQVRTNSKCDNFQNVNFRYDLGIGKVQQVDRLHINPYDGTKVQYLDPITSFPEKMDELLIALNKVLKMKRTGKDQSKQNSFIFFLFFKDLYGYKTSWYICISSSCTWTNWFERAIEEERLILFTKCCLVSSLNVN